MRTYVAALAALALLAALVTVISADPAEDAKRDEQRRAAERAAEDKKRAAEDARRAEELRKSGENEPAVMVNNRAINPLTGKVVGTFKGGSTYLAAMPGGLDNLFWIYDARDSNITILVDAYTCEPWAPQEPHFTVEGKKLTRTKGLHVGNPHDEGGPGGQPKVLRGEKWECELPGRILNDKPSWFAENDEQLYVAYEGGVARLNNLDGKILWTSPGATGSLYAWNDCLYSAGDKLCARRYEKGDIAWSQGLGGTDGEVMHIQEAVLPSEHTGQYVLAVRNGGSSPATRWFSLDGKPLLSINERAENIIYGSEWNVLTPTRYARIKRDGSAAWEVKRDKTNFDADAWMFSGNGAIRLQWGPIEDSGVKVSLYAYESAKPTWTHDCEALGVPHSKYWHKVYAQVRQEKLVVVSQAAGGNFIETLSLSDGKQIARHKP